MTAVDLGRLRVERLPLALAEVHWDGAPGDDVELRLPARAPAAYLLEGAGFELLSSPGGDGTVAHVRARRLRSLPDTVGPGMRLLVCGLNPSLYAADAGVPFARPGNRFWPAAVAAGLVCRAGDPRHALETHDLGLTDLVKRATAGADELTGSEYAHGLARVEHLVGRLRPAAVCFVGLAGWRLAVDRRARPGPVPGGFGGAPAYLCPSTSGRNAHSRLEDLADHLRAAAR